MHLSVLLRTMHVQVCMSNRCCEHQRSYLLHALYRMCICDRCGYIYTYTCIGICIYLYMYMYIYVRMYMYMYPCMYVCVLEIINDLPIGFPINNIISLCMCMCMYMYTYICLCMHACVCVHAYVYTCMYIYKSIRIFRRESACIYRCC